MKQEWLSNYAHLNAQSAAYFLLFMVAVVGFAVWTEWRRG